MIFDVRDYGAVGDGITDDSAAVQAVLDAAAGQGKALLTAGRYLIGNDVTVPNNSEVLGSHATLVVEREGMAAGLVIPPNTKNVTVDNLHFEGPFFGIDTQTFEGGVNLQEWRAQYAENIGIDIRGRWHQREVLEYTKAQMEALTDVCENITIKNCRIEGFGQSGILADQIDGFTAINNTIYRMGHTGILTYGVVGGFIHKNTIGDFFAAYPDGTAPLYNMYGVGCTRLYGRTGWEDPELKIGRPSQDIIVDRNHVWGIWTWKGLDTHGGVAIQFTNNLIEDCNLGVGPAKGGENAVHGIAPARDILVSGNILRQTRRSQNTRNAITATGHDGSDEQMLDGCVITNNTIRDWGGTNIGSAINISNVSGLIIQGNRVLRPSASAIRLSERVQDLSCVGNTIRSPKNYLTFSVLNSGTGYTTPPEVVITGGSGEGARAYADITNGEITEVMPLHPGYGYTSAPTVEIVGGGGSGAVVQANLNPPFGIHIMTSQVDGTIGPNNFSGDLPFTSISLQEMEAGYSVKVSSENTYTGEALPPSPTIWARGSFQQLPKAWANVNLNATSASFRAQVGFTSIERISRGVARIALAEPLTSLVSTIPSATLLGGDGGNCSSRVINTNTIEVQVRDAWSAPQDRSFYVSVLGY